MTQYPLICLILYLLSHYTVLCYSVDCNFTPKDHNHRLQSSISFKCPTHCKKSRNNPPDLRKVELNYRICSHPDLIDTEFKIEPKDVSHVSIRRIRSLNVHHHHRRKRALTLTPQWQSEPQSLRVNQGNKISLVCSITAVGDKVIYQWFYSVTFPSNIGDTLSTLFNGKTDETGTLSIASASGSDAGYYQCKVTDVTKDGTHSIFSDIVDVQIDSYYLTTPSKGKLTENKVSLQAEDVLILDCPSIDSNPPATITWYKNNVAFADQGAFVYPLEGETFQYHSETYSVKKNSLVLMSMTDAHNGVYKCRATNSKTGQYFDLKEYNVQNFASSDSSLEDVKPTVLKEGQITVEKGSTVHLYCLGVGHPATMTYTWTVGDKALTFNARVAQSDFGRQITISNAVSSDAGLYKCSCKNTKGSTDTYITLKVKETTTVPDISITKTPASLYVHDVYQGAQAKSIVIPCTATGADQVRFLKNGALLDASSKYVFKENVGLTFTSYDSKDSGVYQCVAFNSKHWKQKMTFVMITEKVTAKASADVTLLNSEATLSCTVTGYPYPDVSWFYNKEQITNSKSSHSPYVIDSATTHQLVIKNIGFTDGGVYTCKAVSRALNYQPEYSHTASSDVTLTIGDLNPSPLPADNGALSYSPALWTWAILALILSML